MTNNECASSEVPTRRRSRLLFWRIAVAFLCIGGMIAILILDLHHQLSFSALRADREQLLAWVAAYPWGTPMAFAVIYAMATLFVPPSGTVMTVIGGFLFGAVKGTAVVVLGATAGATLVFLAARFVAGDALRRYAGGSVQRMESGFRDNALTYMLVLRLIPLFPFWLVNLAPAFLPVPLRTYVLGTFIGIIPGTAAFAVFGAGLGSILDRNEEISLDGVLTPEILAGLLALAALSALPLAYRRWQRRGTRHPRNTAGE